MSRTTPTPYIFQTIRPLPHLPHSATSHAFLTRLATDPGIKHVMAKYKWTVPLLLEMEPLGNTTHDSKTLGLNRNRGAVIELRLRTDWYDGWRDYKTVRKTLCHELAHNVWDGHGREFWDLTNKLEKEVEANDWKSGGRALTDQVFYNPPEEEVQEGKKGWEGGEFRLGGGGGPAVAVRMVSGGSTAEGSQPSMREVLAKAAEERMRRQAAAAAAAGKQKA
ncbi:WLM domain-domain-containing protein [Tuber borchii]|uniref:WLM domain-domain-containing protein n=1 Tax=Tuber borchii TaxID=42251 RepID=A0A2T6ZZM6_TUBBO|nr:WLM domain-domain-containing protein [Tuber borchii]